MNPQDPLAALHPLRQPEAVSGWPAPGWWLLLVLLLAALLAAILLLRKRRRANAYRRLGEQQLDQLYARYAQDRDTPALLTQVNALLKSVALVAYPRAEVAAMHGREWVGFLNAQLDGAEFPQGFDNALYQPDAKVDVSALEQAARAWIKHHRVAR